MTLPPVASGAVLQQQRHHQPLLELGRQRQRRVAAAVAGLGFSRIAVSEREAPNMLVILL